MLRRFPSFYYQFMEQFQLRGGHWPFLNHSQELFYDKILHYIKLAL